MKHRYPPIFNVIIFAVFTGTLVMNMDGNLTLLAGNVKDAIITTISYVLNLIGFAITNGFEIITKFADRYALFFVHVLNAALYCKLLFSKSGKKLHDDAMKEIEKYKNAPQENAPHAVENYYFAICTLTCGIIVLTVANIIMPNFYNESLTNFATIMYNASPVNDISYIEIVCWIIGLLSMIPLGFGAMTTCTISEKLWQQQ